MEEKISIIGLGSLMSESSARKTCPSLTDFRIEQLKGWRRIFNKTIRRENEELYFLPDGKVYSCLSAVPSVDEVMYVSHFKIPLLEWTNFVIREFEYKLIEVPLLSGEKGVLCVGDYKDDVECELVCSADPFRAECWENWVIEHPESVLWRSDLLPHQPYVDKCLDALREHGDDVLDNWLDTTYLGDNTTTMREYLSED